MKIEKTPLYVIDEDGEEKIFAYLCKDENGRLYEEEVEQDETGGV